MSCVVASVLGRRRTCSVRLKANGSESGEGSRPITAPLPGPRRIRSQYLDRIQGWWAELDSNQRRRKPADLQSAPFGHFGICPFPCGAARYTQAARYRKGFIQRIATSDARASPVRLPPASVALEVCCDP
jgi:hypothetical protein